MSQIHVPSSHQMRFLLEIRNQVFRFKRSTNQVIYILVPVVLVTGVLPTCLVVNCAGALTSYQSFFENGFMLKKIFSLEKN